MNQHARYALAHPVREPERDVRVSHYWRCARRSTACLTVSLDEQPFWQFSVACSDLKGPIPRRQWNAEQWDRAGDLCRYILDPLGVEPTEEVRDPEMTITRQWRKRLSAVEMNQLAVRGTQGRP